MKLGKFNRTIVSTDHPEALKVCGYRSTNTYAILQHVRDTSEKCVFHRATKVYLEYYLGWVENMAYPLEGGLGH